MIKAFRKKEFTSSLMREGLYHKGGSVLCMFLGIMAEQATRFFDLGITVPIASAFCTYIVLMEIGSIIENIGEINPSILPEKLKEHFARLKG